MDLGDKLSERLKHRLKSRGWSEDEIDKVVHTLYDDEKRAKHHTYSFYANRILYWTSLLVLLICNFAISMFLIPFLLVLKTTFVFVIVAVLGLIFGFLFNLLVTDIEHLEKKHHFFAAIFIPLVSIVNVFIMVSLSNAVATFFNMFLHHNPFTLGIVYVVAFLAPYLTMNYENLMNKN